MSDQIPAQVDSGSFTLSDTNAHQLSGLIDPNNTDESNDTIGLQRLAATAETAIGGASVQLGATAGSQPVSGVLLPDNSIFSVRVKDLNKLYVRTRTSGAVISWIRLH